MFPQPRNLHGLILPVMLILLLGAIVAVQPSACGQDNQAADPALRDYLSANGLLSRGMNELAVQEYRKFLSEHADHEKSAVARYGLSVALFRLKKFDEAIVELTQLQPLAKFEYAAEVQFMLGQSYLEQREYAKSAGALQVLVAKNPDHDLADDAAALLAEALYRDGQFKAVQAPSDMMIAKWPASPLRERAEFFAGLARMALEDYAGAAKAFAGMQDRFPKGQFSDRVSLLLAQSLHRSNSPEQAIAQYRAALSKATGDGVGDAQLGLATLLQQQGKSEEAGKLLDQMIEQFPKHRLIATAQLQRGRVWFDARQHDRALEMFQQAAKVDGSPRDELSYWIAKCQMRMGEFAAAATRLTQALHDFPQSKLLPEMTYDRSVALMRAEDSAGALAGLKDFRQKFPEHALVPDAIYLQAMLEHQQNHYAASRELCTAFLQKYAAHAAAESVLFLAAENDFLDNHLDKAVEEYHQFITDHSQDTKDDEKATEQIANARFRLGSALYRLNQLEEAQQALAQVVDGRKTAEPFRRGLLMLGDIRFQQEKWNEAAGLLSDYLSFGLDQYAADDALLKLGLSRARQDKADEALKAFDQLLQQFAQSVHRVQALFERGQILLARKDLDGASDAFTQALSEGKDSRFAPYAMNHLASIAMQRQQFAQAADLFGQVAIAAVKTELEPQAMFQRGQALMADHQYQPAFEAFSKLIKQHAAFANLDEAHAQRAIALARLGQNPEALKAIEQVQQQFAAKLSPELLATIMYEKAWCLRGVGRNEEAVAAYGELLASYERQPISAHAMLELAEIQTTAKQHKEAAALLGRLRQLAADGSLEVPQEIKEPALYRLAVSKYELGEFADTASLCEEFIRDYPQSKMLASAHLFCGEALFKLNKPQQAAEHFGQIAQNFASDSAYAPSLLRLGECQASLSRWPDSEKTFSTYLAHFADSELWFQAQFGLGWACENQQRHDEAIKAYHKVIERHNGPTAARAQFQIGECLFAKKQLDDAVRELLKVDILYGYPEWSAAALYEAGRCFEDLGKAAEARAQFEQVQQKYPQTQWAKLAEQRLTAMTSRAPTGG